jgi:hypothetical protein
LCRIEWEGVLKLLGNQVRWFIIQKQDHIDAKRFHAKFMHKT